MYHVFNFGEFFILTSLVFFITPQMMYLCKNKISGALTLLSEMLTNYFFLISM